MHWDCIQTCTNRALVVRFEDFTAPYKTANQRWYWGIPAQVGILCLSETGPNSAQTDARVHPECTGSALKHASNTHWWCTRGAFRTLHDALRNTRHGKMRKMRWHSSFVIPTQDIRPPPWAAASLSIPRQRQMRFRPGSGGGLIQHLECEWTSDHAKSLLKPVFDNGRKWTGAQGCRNLRNLAD